MIKKSKRAHWVSLFIGRNTAVYLDSFGIEYLLSKSIKPIKKLNQLQAIYLEYKIMIVLYVDFIV